MDNGKLEARIERLMLTAAALVTTGHTIDHAVKVAFDIERKVKREINDLSNMRYYRRTGAEEPRITSG